MTTTESVTTSAAITTPVILTTEKTPVTEAPEEEDVAIGCPVFYSFYSIRDLNTYIRTQSRDPADYSKEPRPSFDLLPKADPPISYDYFPIDTLFQIDESLFDSVQAGFQLASGGIEYEYYLDNVAIFVKQVEAADTLDYFLKKQGGSLTDGFILPYSANATVSDGYVIRRGEDMDVIYRIKDGVKKQASFLMGEFYVTVNGTWHSTDETVMEDYQAFLTSPKTKSIAALFSDNETVYSDVVVQMKKQQTQQQ